MINNRVNKMNTKVFGLLVGILAVNSAFAQEVKMKLRALKVNIASNPYFENWSGEIVNDNTLSFKTPVKKDVPDEMRLAAVIEFDGNVVADTDMTICEAFEDETIGKDVLAKGLPEGKFPKNCPAKAGNDLEISKYVIEKEKIPDSAPDGPFMADISIYEPEKDPYVKIKVEGEITHA